MMIQLSGIVKMILFIVYVTLNVETSSVMPIIFSLEILSYLKINHLCLHSDNVDFKMCEEKCGTLGQILIEIPEFILKLFTKIVKEKWEYMFTQSSVLGLRNLASALMLRKEAFKNWRHWRNILMSQIYIVFQI